MAAAIHGPSHSAPARPDAGGESGERERLLQRAGREFVFAIYAAVRALKLYPLENQATQNALTELESAALRLLKHEGEIALRYVGELCFVNELRLRMDLANYATFGGVGRMLRRHGIGEVTAVAGIGRPEWVALLSLISQEPDPQSPFERVVERLDRARVDYVELRPVSDQEIRIHEDERAAEVAKRTYAYSVAVAREVIGGARLGRGVGVRRVKRAVQSIIDQVLNNETSIVGMTVLRDYDEYTFTHSVNVCIFSVALGKKLNFSKSELYELGLGALLHDIGKARMPVEVINKTTGLSDEEWGLIREHPTEGLLSLLEMQDLSYLPLRAMLAAYEHHMKADLTGYPRSIRPRESHLFARIVQLADAFDAATSKRSYQHQPLLPDQVLAEMRDNPARGHSPMLVRAFISMIGVYPVGSLLVLDNFELAVAVAVNPRPGHAHQPIVRVIFDDLGRPYDPPFTLDLAEVDARTGRPARSILKTADPDRYGIDVAQYFV